MRNGSISFAGDSSTGSSKKRSLSLCSALEALRAAIAATKPDEAEQLQNVQSELSVKLQQHLVLSLTDFDQAFGIRCKKHSRSVVPQKK